MISNIKSLTRRLSLVDVRAYDFIALSPELYKIYRADVIGHDLDLKEGMFYKGTPIIVSKVLGKRNYNVIEYLRRLEL